MMANKHWAQDQDEWESLPNALMFDLAYQELSGPLRKVAIYYAFVATHSIVPGCRGLD